jgi:hypothetical protein
MKYQGEYPVISVDFKNIRDNNIRANNYDFPSLENQILILFVISLE